MIKQFLIYTCAPACHPPNTALHTYLNDFYFSFTNVSRYQAEIQYTCKVTSNLFKEITTISFNLRKYPYDFLLISEKSKLNFFYLFTFFCCRDRMRYNFKIWCTITYIFCPTKKHSQTSRIKFRGRRFHFSQVVFFSLEVFFPCPVFLEQFFSNFSYKRIEKSHCIYAKDIYLVFLF